ncbi:MAG: flagellar basal body P-ring formation chaperone FlgA [bacterium]
MTGAVRLAGALLLAVLAGVAPDTASAQPGRVAVAAREIARGVVLATADIGYSAPALVVSGPARGASRAEHFDPAVDGDTLVGWMTRRLIAVGEVLRAPAVAPPQLVRSGEMVDVVHRADGVLVTMRGRTTRAASLGERVTVRFDNQRKIDAIVIAAGRVAVE